MCHYPKCEHDLDDGAQLWKIKIKINFHQQKITQNSIPLSP